MVVPNCSHSYACYGAMGSLRMEMQTGPWGAACSGNQYGIRMKDDHISILATTFSVWFCDTGDSCVR